MVKSKVREKMDAYTNGEIIKVPVEEEKERKKLRPKKKLRNKKEEPK